MMSIKTRTYLLVLLVLLFSGLILLYAVRSVYIPASQEIESLRVHTPQLAAF